MTNKTVYILRGVSGAGKTTLAYTLAKHLPDCIEVTADDYHYDSEGNYNFSLDDMQAAHNHSRKKFIDALSNGHENVIVHNTNTRLKDMQPYVDGAEQYGYKLVSIVLENRHGNKDVHDVPEHTRQTQERRLRNNLKLI